MRKTKTRCTFFLSITACSFLLWGCGQGEYKDYEDEYIDEYADDYDSEYIDEYEDESQDYSEDGIYIDEYANNPSSYTFTSTLTDEGQIVKKNSEGYTIFYSGDFYGEKISNSDEALNAVYEYLDMLCDDENISLEEDLVSSNQHSTFYTFRQMYNESVVNDSIVKIATDPDGNVLGLISSLKSGNIANYGLLDPEIYSPEKDYFEGKTSSTWSGTVKDAENNSIDITVPVVINPKDGKAYLADADRKIICVDYDEPGTLNKLNVLHVGDGAYSDYVLLYYDLYIKVYDFYVERGWKSPNGRGTPSLVQIDIGTEGTDIPTNMASYSMLNNGYEIVNLSARLPNELDYFTVGHEFTHIVSEANHVGPYLNEFGAINESISDIMGNIIEMTMMNHSTSEWFVSSFEDTTPDGYSYSVWDAEYTPDVYWDNTSLNDHGNVHHNSGIASSISYKLYKAGMSLEDQFQFWLMADLALSPNTDFELFADKLPWCMEIAGLSQYEEALLAAIDACGLKNTEVPTSAPSDMALLRFTYPDIEFCENNEIYFTFYEMDTGYEKVTWPAKDTGEVASVLYPGTYLLSAHLGDSDNYFLYFYDSWMECTEDEVYSIAEDDPNVYLDIDSGVYTGLGTEGLPVN